MGLHIYMSFHQTEGVVFDDVNSLNADLLNNTSFGELYQDILPGQRAEQSSDLFSGPFVYKSPAKILMADTSEGGYFEDYGNGSAVWGCYGSDVWDTIAKHMTDGKLVFLLDIEGNDNEYYIVEPGTWRQVSASNIKF